MRLSVRLFTVMRISLKHTVVKRLFYWEKITFLQKSDSQVYYSVHEISIFLCWFNNYADHHVR